MFNCFLLCHRGQFPINVQIPHQEVQILAFQPLVLFYCYALIFQSYHPIQLVLEDKSYLYSYLLFEAV